ncbi:MAG: CehA/McbA family metallohydrolase [Planctomycetales bacterium]|nr:CehA/McbA family metallohydrolase [Planctomycetales bacterium]
MIRFGGRWQRSPASFIAALIAALTLLATPSGAVELEPIEVDGQPLGAQALRLLEAMEFWGAPLPRETAEAVRAAAAARDGDAIQKALDPHVLLLVSINPEVRVKVARGPAGAIVQQHGFTPLLVKVHNDSTVTRQLRVHSPQAGTAYGGASDGSLRRQRQTELNQGALPATDANRPLTPGEIEQVKQQESSRMRPFLDVEMLQAPPLTANLSGLEVEYALLAVSSSEAGKREATLTFDVGAGTQDIGFRGEAPVLLDVRPAVPVKLDIRDHDGTPSTARLEFRDEQGRVYPPQTKRTAPDFFFQPQIYRHDGETVLLPPGRYTCTSSRGPEYLVRRQLVTVEEGQGEALPIRLKRWINPMAHGFYCGDHHIHGAGCAHYTSPTLGVTPADMFRQVKGEGLNVGCVLTWGPCFEFQRQYFSPTADKVSEPLTLLKYDLEISGFGSGALGHVCLLNLRDQTYPGSAGGKIEGWPTWTVPVLDWCKRQGGVTGYPHSAMHVNAESTAKRLLARDRDGDQLLSRVEAESGLLPLPFARLDRNRDNRVSEHEAALGAAEAADELPNLAVPEMSGAGAMEIFVSVPAGVCDFISAMDTERIQEWNTWYHLLNCGFPLKLSGETDFPCMSSRRVGQGRVYVQLGAGQTQVDFTAWCEGIAAGRSYVSDGYAHALDFSARAGEDATARQPGDPALELARPGRVRVSTTVAMAEETPAAVAHGTLAPEVGGRSVIGNTRELHAPRSQRTVRGGRRLIELVVNGQVAAEQWIPADSEPHALEWEIPIERSSWIAVRHFPQLHTNPIEVRVGGQPIRASRDSAQWCIEAVNLLWENRHQRIHADERAAAREAYDRAIAAYRQRLEETN